MLDGFPLQERTKHGPVIVNASMLDAFEAYGASVRTIWQVKHIGTILSNSVCILLPPAWMSLAGCH